jgi:hypothetical protein
MLIPIQAKYNQNENEKIIAPPWWINDTKNKKCLKIYIVGNKIVK